MTSCNPKDIVFGCVAENNAKFLSQALRLIQSLRWFGGTLSNTEFILCVVEGLDPSYQAHFELLGAKVRIVKRFHHANPYPNKLRFLELPEVELFYTIVLLDCDTIFVQDPADYLKTSSFQARFAGFPTVPTNVFRKLFSQFNLTLPPEEYRCSVTDYPTIWYCNDGVLIFPNKTFRNFFPFWRDFIPMSVS